MKQILRIFILTSMVSITWSQTAGKISGTVQGDDGRALAGANVEVVGTGSGASSNADVANLVVDYTMRNQSDSFNTSNVFSLGIVF